MLLDFLFPKTCLGCGSLGRYVCLSCQKKFEYIQKDPCIVCDKINALGLIHEGCKRKGEMDGSLSIIYYNYTARNIIRKIKYRLVKEAFKDFFLSLDPLMMSKYEKFRKRFPDAVIQPIPLHSKRFNQRGFNQAEIITDFFSEIMNLPKVDILMRTKNTVPQAQTNSKVERHLNIKNAFKIKGKNIRYKNVILVDDVMTTGNTFKEAAKELKKYGVQNVFCFSIAHG
jgi:competence protein ComFC